MNFVVSIIIGALAVGLVVIIPWVGVGALGLHWLFGVIIPYAAMLFFFIGFNMQA